MALQGNGQLLVKVRGHPFASLFGAAAPFNLSGYSLEPLASIPVAGAAFSAAVPADHWLLAKPAAVRQDRTPWDTAHEAAQANGYAHFVEPDILHEKMRIHNDALGMAQPSAGKLDGGFNKDWPPEGNDISPGWHLETGFTGFAGIREKASGAGVRIAHLDTGYTPAHQSTPRGLKPALGYDFWDNKQEAIDPGTSFLGVLQPGHGTATLALLAGNTVDLTFGTGHFRGDLGGAPDAEVVPVRIGPSVVHVYTSTMAKGLWYALAPADNPANRCDVVSISHGGLPSASWADAVNALYEAGVVIVAASGDSFYLEVMDLATRYTVYPSAFNRVLTALGATYLKQPYITKRFGAMQGCWGPDTVMEKAIAAFTPNVAWMQYDDPPAGFSMSGGGTSASTPQIAAACALWMQLNRDKLPADWRRVEACRLALFDGADNVHPDKAELGWGLLNVPEMLDATLAAKIIAKANAGGLGQSAADSVSFPFWRLLVGIGPPDTEEERMYEAEVAQIVRQSANFDLVKAARQAEQDGQIPAEDQAKLRAMLAAETISDQLRRRLGP
jgi:hypothetical protein